MAGKVAIVTGGARGIGRAAARALACAGNSVVLNDTGVDLDGTGADPSPALELADEIRSRGGRALAVPTDARTADGARDVVATAQTWAGGVPASILVHAAGTLRDRMVHRATDDDWREVLGSHLTVAIELTRAVAADMRDQRFGRILYLGGAAGLVGSVGQAAYAVAKAGLFGLTRAVALEMVGRDVCVNYLVPFAYTRMTESINPANDELRSYLASAPLATPEDIAPIIAWLCSEDSAGISGQILGMRGARLTLWSQPRPVDFRDETNGWSSAAVGASLTGFGPHLTPLESEFELLADPPVCVTRP